MKAQNDVGPTILLGITASISAYTACDLIRALRLKGVKVMPVLSRDAHHFVTPLAVQSVANHEVYQDFFVVPGRFKPLHIELAKAADLIVVSPASADTIARLSLGLADDVLSCAVLASEAPVIIAPAMNDKMWANSVTQEHVERLTKRGFEFVGPVVGELVCVGQAMGHIADNSMIVKSIMSALQRRQRGKD